MRGEIGHQDSFNSAIFSFRDWFSRLISSASICSFWRMMRSFWAMTCWSNDSIEFASAMLDRLLHHGHVLKCGPRSWRTKLDAPEQ
jgi:hypothetical protein